jgi:hypothetical protein
MECAFPWRSLLLVHVLCAQNVEGKQRYLQV